MGGGDLLAIEADEINRVEQQRREAAVAHDVGDNLARERKQQPGAFDHHHRMQTFLRNVLDAEHAGKCQIETEQQSLGTLRAAFEFQHDLDIGIRHRRRVDVDLDADLRLLLARVERARRVRIFEREILDVLRQHVELRRHLRLSLGRPAICRRYHENSGT